MTLPKTYGQRDPNWRGVTLGTSQSTIGSHGCAVVSVCMMCEYVGIHVTPPQLNEWLKANKGFINGNLMVWNSIDRFSGGKLTYSGTAKPKQYPQIAEVDLIPNNSVFDQHFVLALDENTCFDPWENKVRPLTDFKGVKSWRIYNYISMSEKPTNSGGNMQAELDNMRKQRDDNWTRGETFRQELEKALDELKSSRSQLESVKKDRNKLVVERDELTELVDMQVKEISQLTGKNNALNEQVTTLIEKGATMPSQSFELNKDDLKSLGRGAVIALAGALIVFLTDVVAGLNFGAFTPFAVALSAVVVNFLRKWVAENK